MLGVLQVLEAGVQLLLVLHLCRLSLHRILNAAIEHVLVLDLHICPLQVDVEVLVQALVGYGVFAPVDDSFVNRAGIVDYQFLGLSICFALELLLGEVVEHKLLSLLTPLHRSADLLIFFGAEIAVVVVHVIRNVGIGLWTLVVVVGVDQGGQRCLAAASLNTLLLRQYVLVDLAL